MKKINQSLIIYNQVINLFDLKDYHAAIKVIRNNFISLTNNYDDIALAYLNCGFLNYKLGDYSSAIDNFSDSIYYEAKLDILDGRSKDISFSGRSNSRYKKGDFQEAIEDKRKAKKITLVEAETTSELDSIRIDYKNILLGTFEEIELESGYKTLIKVSKIKKSKYDLIADYKKVISIKRKEEVIRKLELLSEEKYKVGDYKGSIKAIRRAEKYY